MEFLIELLGELFIEGAETTAKSRRIPKWVRYIALVLLILFYLVIIGVIVLVDIVIIRNIDEVPFLLLILMLGITLIVIYLTIKYFKRFIASIRKKDFNLSER